MVAEIKAIAEKVRAQQEIEYDYAERRYFTFNGACRFVSNVLAQELENAGFNAQMVRGYFLAAGPAYSPITDHYNNHYYWQIKHNRYDHWWVNVDDTYYVDIAADQFFPMSAIEQQRHKVNVVPISENTEYLDATRINNGWIFVNGEYLNYDEEVQRLREMAQEKYKTAKKQNEYLEKLKKDFFGDAKIQRLTSPNGQPSKLNQKQYDLVRTPNFKAWFGDWEKLAKTKIEDSGIDEISLERLSKNVSTLVDENGEPLEAAIRNFQGLFAEGGQLELFDEIKDVTEDEIAAVKDNFKATPESVRLLRLENPDPQLTFFSFGGGQDSWCILYKMIYDPDFRKKYAPNDLVIGMSDTGNEFPYTYKYLKEAIALATSFGIHFQFITPNQGFHTEGWPNLKYNLKKNDNILSAQMQRQPCTINLKINVVDKYMHHYMCQKYFPEIPMPKNKNGWKLYRDKFKTKARVIIGFATDEEKRVEKSHRMHLAKNKEGKPVLPKWKTENIQYVYPMVEEGWNRAAAQDIILQYRKDLPPPSNCMICFYQSDQELLWLERNYSLEFYEWVELERRKLEKFNHLEKNYGVYGAVTLLQRLDMAKAKFGHLTDEQLWEYKMSHGHCVKSAY